MKIQIIRKIKLIDGEQYYDKIETVETKQSISFSMIRKYNIDGNIEKVIYMQVSNFLNKEFKEYEITEKDMIFIEGE